MLKEAEETFERKYKVKKAGLNCNKIEMKVLELFEIEKDELDIGSRKKDVSEARSIYCYLCVKEPGETMTDPAKRLGLTQPAVGYSVDRGKRVAEKRGIDLKNILYNFLWTLCPTDASDSGTPIAFCSIQPRLSRH